MFVQRRAPRHDYKLILVQRKAPRRDYKLFFVQRRAPRHDYKLILMQRKAPRRDYKLFLCSGKPLAATIHLCLERDELFSGNLITRTIREMVGAAPVCPPERPRSGVSIRKGHVPYPQKRRFHPQRAYPLSTKEAFPSVEMFVDCA